MNHCILCWIKFLNKPQKDIRTFFLDSNLITRKEVKKSLLCDICKLATRAPKFTEVQARMDEKNIIYGLTITLKPRLQKVDPTIIHEAIRQSIKKLVDGARTPFACRLWPELSPKNHNYHLHGWIAARPLLSGKITAWLKSRVGYIQYSNITNLMEWEDYCMSQGEAGAKKDKKLSLTELAPIEIRS